MAGIFYHMNNFFSLLFSFFRIFLKRPTLQPLESFPSRFICILCVFLASASVRSPCLTTLVTTSPPLPPPPPQAIAARDTLAKCVYAALFDWIVLQVNSWLLAKKDVSREHHGPSIGVLDIFGFEDFGNINRWVIVFTWLSGHWRTARQGFPWRWIRSLPHAAQCDAAA